MQQQRLSIVQDSGATTKTPMLALRHHLEAAQAIADEHGLHMVGIDICQASERVAQHMADQG